MELYENSNSSNVPYGHFKCRYLMAIFNPYREAQAPSLSRSVGKAVGFIGRPMAKVAPAFLVNRLERQLTEQI